MRFCFSCSLVSTAVAWQHLDSSTSSAVQQHHSRSNYNLPPFSVHSRHEYLRNLQQYHMNHHHNTGVGDDSKVSSRGVGSGGRRRFSVRAAAGAASPSSSPSITTTDDDIPTVDEQQLLQQQQQVAQTTIENMPATSSIPLFQQPVLGQELGIGSSAAAAAAAMVPSAITEMATSHRKRRPLVSVKQARSAWDILVNRGPHDQEIFEQALPTFGAVMIEPCLALVDTAYVGRLGSLALGAVGPCNAIYNLIFATSSCVFMTATSVMVSKRRALGDSAAVGRAIVASMGTALLLGTFFMLAISACPAVWLRSMAAPEAIMNEAVPFLVNRSYGMIANMFLLVSAGAFRGIGMPSATLRTGVVVGVVNLILDPIFMFTMGMRTPGAALATSIAQWMGVCVYASQALTNKETRERMGFGHIKTNWRRKSRGKGEKEEERNTETIKEEVNSKSNDSNDVITKIVVDGDSTSATHSMAAGSSSSSAFGASAASNEYNPSIVKSQGIPVGIPNGGDGDDVIAAAATTAHENDVSGRNGWESRASTTTTAATAIGSLRPTKADFKEFFGSGIALLFRQLANVGSWTYMARAATSLGVLQIAAHQLILSLWLVIAYVQEALGLAGQVLVARYFGMAKDPDRLPEHSPYRDPFRCMFTARVVAKRVLVLSFVLGVTVALLGVVALPLITPLVCTSPEVRAVALRVFPLILGAFPICCCVWSADCLFYGASDFAYNAKTVTMSGSMATLGVMSSMRLNFGLRGIWGAMTYIFFGARATAHFFRFNSVGGPFGRSSDWLDEQSALRAKDGGRGSQVATSTRSPTATADVDTKKNQ